MHVIHDTLGGSLPGPPPLFPSNLPPVRPPQEAPQLPATTTDAAPVPTAPPSAAASPEQLSSAPSAAASAAAVIDLQYQLRDTRTSLASHLDKETAHLVHQHTHDSEEPRGGFDMEEDKEYRETSDDDVDDDARSMSTVVPHELERVEEEDEDQITDKERMEREDGKLSENKEHEDELLESEEEERERRREDLGLGRPRTPEPTRMGMDYPSLLSSAPQRSMTSPLAQLSASDDVYDQVQKLSKQVSTVMALTTTLEAQHSAAQTTIQSLENKVEALEGMSLSPSASSSVSVSGLEVSDGDSGGSSL